jgi:hypothetical protein
VDQQAGFDAQIVDLKKASCEPYSRSRWCCGAPQLDAAIDFAREGDTSARYLQERLYEWL